MSSAERVRAQMPANKLYINLAGIQSTIFQENGSTLASWLNDSAANGLQTIGSAVLRDMGVTKYVPGPEVPGGTFQSTLLRKVQLVTAGDATGAGVSYSAAASNYYTGYIKMGPTTYGGATDNSFAKVARLQ